MDTMASHLQTRHEDETSDNSLSTLLSWAAVQKMGITSCPLCESSGPEDSPELVEHVLRHAYDFALRALPWPQPWVHEVNVPPGDFKLPNDPEQGDHLQRWIDEAAHEGPERPKLELCHYDRMDHADPSPTNVPEYSEYFVHNAYFGDTSEGRSSKPQAEPSTASTRSSTRTVSDTGPVDAASIQRSCIPEFQIGTLHNPAYLPLSRFSQFVREDRIMATLQHEPYFAPFSAADFERFVRYSEKNPKIFLTLVMSNVILYLPALMFKHCEDDDLPLWPMLGNGNTTDLMFYSINDWRLLNYSLEATEDDSYGMDKIAVNDFVSNQWTFCAVVFDSDDFDRSIFEESPLPFVGLGSQGILKGQSGMSFRAGLCAEHGRTHPQYLTEVSTTL